MSQRRFTVITKSCHPRLHRHSLPATSLGRLSTNFYLSSNFCLLLLLLLLSLRLDFLPRVHHVCSLLLSLLARGSSTWPFYSQCGTLWRGLKSDPRVHPHPQYRRGAPPSGAHFFQVLEPLAPRGRNHTWNLSPGVWSSCRTSSPCSRCPS